jgi:hypothetical protein
MILFDGIVTWLWQGSQPLLRFPVVPYPIHPAFLSACFPEVVFAGGELARNDQLGCFRTRRSVEVFVEPLQFAASFAPAAGESGGMIA